MDESQSQYKLQVLSRRVQPFKELARFEKHYRIPKLVTPGERQFLHELCSHEIVADLDQKFSLFRNQLGLKRKQLESRPPEDCQGVLATPLFDYVLEVDFLEQDPSKICWQRSLARIQDLKILQQPVVKELFGNEQIQLQVQVDYLIDLEQFVDFVEEDESLDLMIDYDRELTWCEIGSKSMMGKMRISKNELTVFHSHSSSGLDQLFEAWMFFQLQLQQAFPSLVRGSLSNDEGG